MFTHLDRQNLPCFLDTNNEKNLPIYERFGFKILEEYQIPDTNLVNWAMLRASHQENYIKLKKKI